MLLSAGLQTAITELFELYKVFGYTFPASCILMGLILELFMATDVRNVRHACYQGTYLFFTNCNQQIAYGL